MNVQRAPLETRYGAAVAALLALLFLAFRVVLLLVRAPFLDELYTVWMARQPLGSIVPHLLHDSGPPLYYFIARLQSVDALRWLSVIFASIAFLIVITRRSLGDARFIAAALLAVYPPAAFYATEARSYALCGLLVTIGILLWDDDRPFAAAIAFVVAAYAHYYGVLFFPVLLVRGRCAGGRAQVFAFLIACVLFLPGLVLALHQPVNATAWNAFQPLLSPLYNAGFAGRYSPALFNRPPVWIIAIACVVLIVAVARSWRFAPAVLIPIGLAIAFSLAGRRIYFPMRFESVTAVPLILWITSSLERWRPAVRRALMAAMVVIGTLVLSQGALDLASRPPEPCTVAAELVARWRSETVVAADYCYLNVWSVLGPRVIAFPPELAEHPAWYVSPTAEAAQRSLRSLPATGFIFIGSSTTPESVALRQARRLKLMFRDGRTDVFWVEPEGLTTTVH